MAGSDQGLFAAIQAAGHDPARPFLILPDGRELCYGACLTGAGQTAAALVAAGVRPGDRVAAQVEKGPEALLLYLGCLCAGAVYLPLNTAYTDAEVGYFLGDAEPKLAVCRPERAAGFAQLAQPIGARVLTLAADGSGSWPAAVLAAGGPVPLVPRGPDDLAAILYTSGTTGRSKGAMLSHGNLLSNAQVLVEAWRFTAADVLLHALPIFHTHGLFTATNTALLAGGSMLFLPAFDAEEVLRLLPQATLMMGVPTFYARLLAKPGLTRELVAHVRVFISGSAPLSPETHKAFAARTGHAILERYGMTETSMNSSNPYDGERRPGTVGQPLPGIEIRITEPASGRPLAAGEVGMIEIRGPNVFQGYWRMPDKTAAEFRADGFFVSGDLGRFDADGYLAIVGRDKDLIISGGFNVYPAEIEAAIDALPPVAESAVIGLPHPDFGEGVAAAVVLRPGAAADEAALRQALGRELASYKLPKRILFLPELPRNAMGKVQKTVLRSRYRDLFTAVAG